MCRSCGLALSNWLTDSSQLDALTPSVITVGNFDGVHLGHQSLINKVCALAAAENLAAGIITFTPHPVQVLSPEKPFQTLYSDQDLLSQLQGYPLTFAFLQEFNINFAKLSPRDFVSQWLVPHFAPKHIVVGDDFRFGHNQAGGFEELEGFGKAFDFQVHRQPQQIWANQRISTSLIKEKVRAGEMQEVRELLGRPFAMTSEVVHDQGVGKSLGAATANLLSPRTLVPKVGVYATHLFFGGKGYPSVTNVGIRPTVSDEGRLAIETHVIGEQLDLYGQEIKVEFLHYLRDEIKFESKEQLRQQIQLDIARASEYLNRL